MKSPALCWLPVALILPLLCTFFLHAEDWPQWRGPQRDGVWRETGILQAFPPGGLKVSWRIKIGAGYSGPVVAKGRVYVTDRKHDPDVERVLCFDEITGKLLWTHAYPCDYQNMEYASGPRGAPLVHEGKVYTLGATGLLFCLNAIKGDVLWKKDLMKEYNTGLPRWGFSSIPVVEGNLLLLMVGGQPEACMVALDRNTGKEVWKTLKDRPSYSSPIVIDAGGKRQVIVRTADSMCSLAPATGKIYWQLKWKIPDPCHTIAMPVVHSDLLFSLSGWSRGAKMLKLDTAKPGASTLWETRDNPHASIATPLFLDSKHVCVVYTNGMLACHDTTSGELLWSTRQPTGTGPGGNIHLTPNGDRVFLFNQKGELILAQLTPQGYKELGRTGLLEPTAGTPTDPPVTWSHPAYANKHIFVRNDKELIRVSLAEN